MLFTHSFIDPTDCKDNGESGVSRSSPFCYCRKRRWVTMPLNLLGSVWIESIEQSRSVALMWKPWWWNGKNNCHEGTQFHAVAVKEATVSAHTTIFYYKHGAKFEQMFLTRYYLMLNVIIGASRAVSVNNRMSCPRTVIIIIPDQSTIQQNPSKLGRQMVQYQHWQYYLWQNRGICETLSSRNIPKLQALESGFHKDRWVPSWIRQVCLRMNSEMDFSCRVRQR